MVLLYLSKARLKAPVHTVFCCLLLLPAEFDVEDVEDGLTSSPDSHDSRETPSSDPLDVLVTAAAADWVAGVLTAAAVATGAAACDGTAVSTSSEDVKTPMSSVLEARVNLAGPAPAPPPPVGVLGRLPL